MKATEHESNRVCDRLSQLEDSELVRIAKFQLPYVTAAYEVLFHRYHKPLVRICYRYLRSMEEAEETVSDTMFNVFNNIRQFEQRASFKTWVYKIAHNLALSKLRKKQLQLVDMNEAAHVAALEIEDGTHESKKQIDQWLDTLSIEDRSIIVFRVVGDLEFLEIAQIVDQKLSTVKMRYKRALDKIKEKSNQLGSD
ncbi:sigma-70 family RNA polymerase sigma factor [Paraglaciecola aquimarina]|uniref:Sigma-70 family RNA polymerase sigma factor n=1 Tax=Paraglaciecola aquimarina TaxID=1235557 RepID=A0ABU3SYW9_9ALTE|nr:sigma-70 family RNA polymerase sigma factor [Paraglaciecola aquimarina]MDU0355203.1 sigma-70 family RNA polymerase sigma factor [Paraglaciecola aquimarina]